MRESVVIVVEKSKIQIKRNAEPDHERIKKKKQNIRKKTENPVQKNEKISEYTWFFFFSLLNYVYFVLTLFCTFFF